MNDERGTSRKPSPSGGGGQDRYSSLSRLARRTEDFQSCAFPGKRVRAIGAGDGFGDLSGPADALRPVTSAVTERGYAAEEGHARPLKEGERAGHLARIVEEGDQRCFYCVTLGEV